MLGAPQIVVATTNVGHLSRFVPADLWQNISPKGVFRFQLLGSLRPRGQSPAAVKKSVTARQKPENRSPYEL